MENLERVLATQTSTSSTTAITVTTRMNERILFEHTATCLTLEGDGREEVLGRPVDEENDRFFPHVVPGDVSTFFKAAMLDTIAPLADRQDNNIDSGVSGQLELAKERAVEKNIGHTIANRQCLHPVCLRKPWRMQLE